MTIKEMKERKIELGFTNEMISRASGVPLSTIQKIFGGATKAPRKITLDAIARALGEPDEKPAYDLSDRQPGMVREAGTVYQTAGKEKLYTIEDYYALPEDQRAELIDGKFYFMNAPAFVHQMLLGRLHIAFYHCIQGKEVPCEVFLAPCDVRLDKDNYTMVQPDLLVICRDEDFLHAKRLEGAPDLAVEILSSSTRSKDMVLKLYKYQKAGVREYWIVDPKNQVVIVHCFENEDYIPVIYTFDDKIPVGISAGHCVIDFGEIKKDIYGDR